MLIFSFSSNGKHCFLPRKSEKRLQLIYPLIYLIKFSFLYTFFYRLLERLFILFKTSTNYYKVTENQLGFEPYIPSFLFQTHLLSARVSTRPYPRPSECHPPICASNDLTSTLPLPIVNPLSLTLYFSPNCDECRLVKD